MPANGQRWSFAAPLGSSGFKAAPFPTTGDYKMIEGIPD